MRRLGFALVVSGMVVAMAGVAALGAPEPKIVVQYPTPKAFRVLEESDTLLAQLAAGGNREAADLQKEVPVLRRRLRELDVAAAELLKRNLEDTDRVAVVPHNAECDKVLQGDLGLFCDRSQVVLNRARLQLPCMMTEIAAGLANSGQFKPDAAGATHDNSFLDNFAKLAFDYDGFHWKTVNAIVDAVRRGRSEWKPIHDSTRASEAVSGFQAQLDEAQSRANAGYLVVVGLKTGSAGANGGRLAIVMPGKQSPNDDWEAAGLPRLLPQVAQAGAAPFAGKALCEGFTTDDAHSPDFVLYFRSR